MLKRPDQGSKLGKPAGMGFSSVQAPPVVPIVKSALASASDAVSARPEVGDEEMVDLD